MKFWTLLRWLFGPNSDQRQCALDQKRLDAAVAQSEDANLEARRAAVELSVASRVMADAARRALVLRENAWRKEVKENEHAPVPR